MREEEGESAMSMSFSRHIVLRLDSCARELEMIDNHLMQLPASEETQAHLSQIKSMKKTIHGLKEGEIMINRLYRPYSEQYLSSAMNIERILETVDQKMIRYNP